ncbi:pentapeptide repeat-containing protein [Pseudonocardia parietis]|uniref:Pentapeptide repeat protein n=1 Tax=Pseudonocardia parietis TaxID=570936 RepID=A0ABS4W5V9_9PSEU|nr:pentapeptide repeat-containing protein [Pseudonocardia parietis]MBP2371381.1 hypothetical protein [Pseudonocardia parietis]
MAGLAATAGLYVGYRKQRNDEGNTLREQDRVFTERFGAAASLLEGGTAAARLAGIQSFVRLADDSPRDSFSCLSMVCSYLRLPIKLVPQKHDRRPYHVRVSDITTWEDASEWDVRRNALKLLLDRLSEQHDYEPLEYANLPQWDLREAVVIEPNFARRMFDCSIDFSEAVLIGPISFDRTTLGGRFNFQGCVFEADFDLSGVHFPNLYAPAFESCLFLQHAAYDRINSWGLMPTFSGSAFNGGAAFLWNLDLAFGYDDRIVGSTVELHLTECTFLGDVVLPGRAVDVRGSDFSDTSNVSLLPYENHSVTLPLLRTDSTTKWPAGFDLF